VVVVDVVYDTVDEVVVDVDSVASTATGCGGARVVDVVDVVGCALAAWALTFSWPNSVIAAEVPTIATMTAKKAISERNSTIMRILRPPFGVGSVLAMRRY
jgi:hypothetical protein